ncbi:hypothetical protein [Lacipirellula limnantheis]|uniref:IRE (Iron responsive element) n=1 Tax=Lacipirellula limnantheis TaxID=2528024 RepID=A0A517TVK8_9BACT|nr:hypothetical protein [Lacipirellula limnantheis]QDT72415.1 hypothetical protein I41_15930 [Lacipirellula limnantheis]
MNSNNSFFRKMVYLLVLMMIAVPIVWLGRPSSPGDQGGKLAQQRTEARLGQADLGAIDPASETIRLATLGLRGIAVTMLWNAANNYKKTEDWTAFQSTLEQLARLQPYFVKVWQYQAWNLSYNVSVELDNVRDRFYYVKQGIEYLMDGIGYNRDHPRLLDDLGWFTGNKVGRADEHEIYRKLYKLDEDLNPNDDPTLRDNWLASKHWYEQAVDAVDQKGQSLSTMNPTTFFDSPARSQISYAEAIEEEGIFGETAKRAWREGARLWKEYGEREMKSTDDFMIRLVDENKWKLESARLRNELDALDPGIEAKMKEEAQGQLTADQRRVWESLPATPTPDEQKWHSEAMATMDVSVAKIAARIAKDHPENAAKAQSLATRIDEANRRANLIGSNRDVANYEYWRIRCNLEQTSEALKARDLAHQAENRFAEGDPEGAMGLYEQSFVEWGKSLDQFPEMPRDSTTGGDLMEFIEDYAAVLEQLDLSLEDEEVANRFALWELLEINDQQRKFAGAIEAHKARQAGMPVPKREESESNSLINPAEAVPQ